MVGCMPNNKIHQSTVYLISIGRRAARLSRRLDLRWFDRAEESPTADLLGAVAIAGTASSGDVIASGPAAAQSGVGRAG